MRIPVLIQTRKELHTGTIKKVLVWCKFVDDIPKYRKLNRIYSQDGRALYEILDTELEIRNGPEIEKTFEQEEGA